MGTDGSVRVERVGRAAFLEFFFPFRRQIAIPSFADRKALRRFLRFTRGTGL
jgi:hypothetical protein